MLRETIAVYGQPEISNSGKGAQYTCANWVDSLSDLGIRISMHGKGRATGNAIIERWFRTLKQKYAYLNPPQTGLSLFHGIRKFVEKYNNRRHKGINHKKPVNMYQLAE